MPRLIKVTGTSMEPTLKSGDYILTLKPRAFRAGLIYVIMHERYGQILKRLGQINGQTASFKSDNPDGTSGEIPTAHIKARAWLAITPAGIKKL